MGGYFSDGRAAGARSADRCRSWDADCGKPAVTICFLPAGERKKFVLDPLGDGTSRPVADGYPIDGADGSDLNGRPAEEDFFRDIKHLSGNDLLAHGNIKIAAELHDCVARDSGKSSVR